MEEDTNMIEEGYKKKVMATDHGQIGKWEEIKSESEEILSKNY